MAFTSLRPQPYRNSQINRLGQSKSYAALLCLTLLSACAPAMQSSEMQPETRLYDSTPENKYLTNAVSIGNVAVAEQAQGSALVGVLTAPAYQEALRNSFLMAGYLAKGGKAPTYLLDATITKLDQETFGFSMTSVTEATYTLRRVADQKEVYHDTLRYHIPQNLQKPCRAMCGHAWPQVSRCVKISHI